MEIVKGIDNFEKVFAQYSDSFIIIGGSACRAVLADGPIMPRRTRDIDMVLVLERISHGFSETFKRYIQEGEYKCATRKNKFEDIRYVFYSFVEGKEGYPDKIELLSKPSPLMEIKEGDHIEFIQLTDDYSHLSAIIMDEQYYNYLMDHYEIHNGIRYASIDSLICLKALAYLNLLNEKEAGRQVNDEDLSKHRRDVFMAVASLEVDASFEVPYNIRRMLDVFLSSITDKRIIQSLSDSLGLNQEQVLSLKQVLNNCFVSLE